MDSKILLIFILSFVASQAFSENVSINTDWDLFKSKYSKVYGDQAEDSHRMNIFMNNLETITEHNQRYERGEVSFRMAINKFGDLTTYEFNQLTGGLGTNIPVALKLNANGQTFIGDDYAPIPDFVDWRDQGAVTPVKDQGECASCWAFAAVGALEGQHFLKTGQLVSFSEQNLIDCSSSYGNIGCVGGWAHDAFQYIHDNGGIESDVTYPYEAVDNTCKFNSSNSITSVQDFVMIPERDEMKLAEAIATIGPIAVAFDSNHTSFQHYSGGTYYEPECNEENLTHMVTAVGYGTDENGLEYYLMKNSWGSSWGDNGYFRMIRNYDNNCGVASKASYPIV